jgi:transcriptional regulator with GAF, ATPase, and Fis domain
LAPAREADDKRGGFRRPSAERTVTPDAIPSPVDGPLTLEGMERRHIANVLRRTGWKIDGPDGAARLLELNPSTLRSRIKKLGIQRGESQIS